MFYHLKTGKKKDIEEIKTDEYTLGIMTFEELKFSQKELHINERTIKRLEETTALTQNVVIPYKNYYLSIVNLINEKDIFKRRDIFALIIFKHLLLVVVIEDPDTHINEAFERMRASSLNEGSIAKSAYYMLTYLIGNDYEYLDALQAEISSLEKIAGKGESALFNNKIRLMNKELLILYNYYENLIEVGEELQVNDHEVFAQEDLRFLEIFTRRVERLSSNTMMLQELTKQISDFHQSELDYSLNKTMQFFTVVTTIFLPLTLVTGWYGMNFTNMPELNWQYSYYVIMGISFLIVLLTVYWCKKKKYF